jgi:hypothetical protein
VQFQSGFKTPIPLRVRSEVDPKGRYSPTGPDLLRESEDVLIELFDQPNNDDTGTVY